MIEHNMKPGHEHDHGIGCHQTHKHQQQHKGKPPSHKKPTVQKSSTNKLLMNYYVFPLPPGTYWKYLKVIWLLMRVCFLHDRAFTTSSLHTGFLHQERCRLDTREKQKGWVFFIQAAGLSAKWHPSKPIIIFNRKSPNASRFVCLAFA